MITDKHPDYPAASAELPRYRCHKEVWALKIKEIALHPIPRPTIAELEEILKREEQGAVEISPNSEVVHRSISTATITPEDARYAPFLVDAEYVAEHEPHAGGYYVVYKDGYKSFSPATVFEEGYTRI